jgi:hypothetical protein
MSLTKQEGGNDNTTERGMLKTLQEAVDENCNAGEDDVNGQTLCGVKVPSNHWVDEQMFTSNALLDRWSKIPSLQLEMSVKFKPYRANGATEMKHDLTPQRVREVFQRYNSNASMRFSGDFVDANTTMPAEFLKLFKLAWTRGGDKMKRGSKAPVMRFAYTFGSAGNQNDWASIFIDRATRCIEYFHPRGDPVIAYKVFVNEAEKWLTEQHALSSATPSSKWKTIESEMTHRGANQSDGGMYQLWYVNERIGGRTFDEIKSRKMRNDIVLKKEKHFFRAHFDVEKAKPKVTIYPDEYEPVQGRDMTETTDGTRSFYDIELKRATPEENWKLAQ